MSGILPPWRGKMPAGQKRGKRMRYSYSKQTQLCMHALRHNSTPEERRLWSRLRAKRFGLKFRRQVPIGKYIVDFVCLEKNLIIEVDGSQHAEDENDTIRTAYLEQSGFKVIRFWNKEINQNLEMCLDKIYFSCFPKGTK